VLSVRVRFAVFTLTTIVLLTFAAVSAARPSSRGPTRKQMLAAVHTAERSRYLWATVNVCNTRRYPDAIGIRAQMPALGFTTTLQMEFQVDQRSAHGASFRPVSRAKRAVSVGSVKRGLQQEGVTFSLGPDAGDLRGTVKFEWRLGRRVLGRSTRVTTRGHPTANFSDPPRYSASRCIIG
jgi:hypothetical protein